MREIVPGIETWQWFSEPHGYDFNGYLVRHAGGALVVDPVEPDAAALDAIDAARPSEIVLTNRNHFRAAARIYERTGARVLCHPADAEFVRGKGVLVGGSIEADQSIGPFRILDASGKSPGEIALHWPERRILIVGDACVGKVPGELALLPERVMDDPAALRRSLARLADTVDFDVLLVGDGHSILGGAREALVRLVASFA